RAKLLGNDFALTDTLQRPRYDSHALNAGLAQCFGDVGRHGRDCGIKNERNGDRVHACTCCTGNKLDQVELVAELKGALSRKMRATNLHVTIPFRGTAFHKSTLRQAYPPKPKTEDVRRPFRAVCISGRSGRAVLRPARPRICLREVAAIPSSGTIP